MSERPFRLGAIFVEVVVGADGFRQDLFAEVLDCLRDCGSVTVSHSGEVLAVHTEAAVQVDVDLTHSYSSSFGGGTSES